MRLGMNFTITPKNVILWPKEKATGRSALGVFEDAIAALLQPATPPAELAALRAEVERLKAENENLRVMQGARTVTLGKMQQQLTAAVTRAERAEGALAKHHKWHQEIGKVLLVLEPDTPAGSPAHVPLDLSAEYSESAMCEETMEALAAARDAKGMK
jgi:hypothetical protein